MSFYIVLSYSTIVLCGTRSEVVENILDEWRRAMEDRGRKINIHKTVYLRFNVDGNLGGNSEIKLQGHTLERVNTLNTYERHWQKMETWMRR